MKRRTFLTAASLCSLLLCALAPSVFPPPVASAQTVKTGTTAGTTAAAPDWRSKVDARVLDALAVGPAEFLIYMRQQADLSGASALRSKAEKGRYVYERLTATAATTQSGVRRTLEQFGATYQTFWVSNTIHAKGGAAVVQAVASHPEVAAIYPVGKGKLMLPPEAGAASSTNSTGGASSASLTAADRSPEPGLVRVNADDV